ncbi:MAG: hypothetical protein BGN92_05745 [Sphingobacteriales bacterium 41-5]|nr:MAG: hypothetical protein BGN92_05745 [Sphingobacteriales bacterium 41-5]
MKIKLFLTMAIFISIVPATEAQFRTGVKGGLVFSRFSEDIDPFAKNSKYSEDYIGFQKVFRSGATGGFFAEFMINNATRIGGELLFAARGSKYRYHNSKVYLLDEDGNKSKAYDTYTYQTDYLELPVYLQLDTRAGFNTVGISVYGGVAPAVPVNRKRVYRYYDIEGFAAKGDQKKMKRELENVRAFNLFPLVGIKLGSDRAFLDLRYSTTFRPVFGNSPTGPDTDFNTRMSSLSATVGIYF